jgi:D-aspartate ligase
MPPHCFVLGLFDTGLAVIRALAREGVPVRGFDSQPTRFGFQTRYGQPEVCPDPVAEPEALIAFLLRRTEGLSDAPVLYPTSDAFVTALSEHRERLHPRFRLSLPSREAVAAATNKARQYEIAATAGVPVAPTYRPSSIADLEAVIDRIEYPVIIKPEVGHLWRREFRADKAILVEHRDDLMAHFREILPSGHRALIQALILGPNTNHCKVCAYIDGSGHPLALMCMRKVRQYPTDFGVGTLMESVHEPELADLGLRFFAAMNWRGPGSIEFKRDDRDGVWKLIELNPRFWQQNGLTTDCGMNFPLLGYLELTGRPQTVDHYEIGRRWMDEFRDPRSAWAHHRAGRLGFLEWLRSLRAVRSFALFAWDDPRPFIASVRHHASVAVRRAWQRSPAGAGRRSSAAELP